MYDVAMTMLYEHEPVIDKKKLDLIVVVVISRNNNHRLLVFGIPYSS